MRYFPFFFDLQNSRVLIVGGSMVACRKAALIARAGARPTVVAPEICPELDEIVRNCGGSALQREYEARDIGSHRIVIAATDMQTNRKVCADARKQGVPVNVVDCPSLCDFIFPAIIDRSPVIAAVSTSGESPVLARRLRAKFEAELPLSYSTLAKLCGKWRNKVKKTLPEKLRRPFWEDLLDGPVAEAVLAGDPAAAERLLAKHLDNYATGKKKEGEVALIGTGPGDPDLLTLRAYRLLQRADVVVYDRLVAPAIVDMARRDAEKIFAGKMRNRHKATQKDINELLTSKAAAGNFVARLKGGDPFIFGRGGEEAAALSAAGIPFQIVPGITAAAGCAAYAGIPLTHRGLARSVRFTTVHRKDTLDQKQWRSLAEDRQSTLVFYMAGDNLPTVVDSLMRAGLPPGTPAAVVTCGSTPAQKVATGTLSNLAAHSNGATASPALIVVGEVVRLRDSLKWFNCPAKAESPFPMVAS